MVNYPSIALIVVIAGLSTYAGLNKLLPEWTIAIGFIVAFVCGWLYWSRKITKWRIWAFEHVRNVKELKKRAVLENLIWQDDSWFERTEIRTREEKEKWSALKKKMNEEDAFEDDFIVPAETIIYYSKGKNLVEMSVMILVLGMGIYLIVQDVNLFLGLIFSGVGIYFGYREYRQATNKTPQLIINEKGLETVTAGFYVWNQIYKEDVISKRSGKHTNFYLSYNHPNGNELLHIDDLETDYQTLIHLLMVYRGRYKRKMGKD